MSKCQHDMTNVDDCGRVFCLRCGDYLGGALRTVERSKVAQTTPASALNIQVAGRHYKDMAIQPVEFIHANKLGFLEGCIVKRICRWRSKDGIQDLEKIKHEVDLLIELEKRGPHAAK